MYNISESSFKLILFCIITNVNTLDMLWIACVKILNSTT